ncbi:MAG: AmmeMemoRadiSam system radical SAM enzyme [Candidatus Parcubacteria bacterium]|nr:AmmeMemoRadiSam system radical SAM enzyme [Candidatus Parcubacteria bacterium]
MKQALFWRKKLNNIQCQLCSHYCLISEERTGICAVRKNIKGTLYSLVYGKVIAANIDPIEKKPLFHFLPGSLSYSIATVGCNFRCAHCQNADISQLAEKTFSTDFIPGQDIEPQEIINQAKLSGCQSIAYTYTEPTIFAEFALDCMKLAKKAGLKNVWVSNGYTAKEVWAEILPYLDAINIDLKFFTDENYLKICGAKLDPVLDNLKFIYHNKIHLEITTLIIPGLNDNDQELINIAKFIKNELSADVPWHVSRFFPQYKLADQNPTEEELIYKAISIGKEVGLNYVYGGNVSSEELENTYCPQCGELIIKRDVYNIERFDDNSLCPKCKRIIDIRI